jgi:hypothetical protein
MRMCSGCGTKLSELPPGRCAECRKPTSRPDGLRLHVPAPGEYTSARGQFARLYGSTDWKKTARLQLQLFPMCEMCNKKLAVLCDHFIPAEEFVALCDREKRFLIRTQAFFYMPNLQSLCAECHGTKTDDDKNHRGPWPDLFANPRRAPRKWSF